jgi:hypothetical protein
MTNFKLQTTIIKKQKNKLQRTNKSLWKFQMTKTKSQTNHNDKNSKLQTGFDHWILRFEICLGFEY